jgi:hypothetical protein
MKFGKLLLSASSLLALIACGDGGDGGGSGGGNGNKANSGHTTELAIKKEEVVLRVGGSCGQNRNYRVLETELIPQDNGDTAVGQLILLDDGTYSIVAETFSITQKGTKLYNYNRGQDRITQGKWSIESGRLKTEQGTLTKIADLSANDGDEYYEFTDSSDEHARKVIFRSIEKLSERYIPAERGCPNQQSLIARKPSGKFAIEKTEELEGEHLFRNTPDRWDLENLMSGNIGSHEDDNYFCKIFGQEVENCEAWFTYLNSQEGAVNVSSSSSDKVDRMIDFKMRVDDNHFEILTFEGTTFYLVPQPGVRSFFLEETEESFNEL